ncbi:MAG: carbamoyl-phosphate synthase large subunit [Candidatus Thermoplasmatota archaeon]|nr:carbamoyl-phosphate synthase large subunit [Candidatus Thermoplasmatota archaeon]MEC7697537.1 carbamoyl-phosphate synthase large subunit [Candidatus Thermoplasmatota archaeon]MEC8446108.1 carbamoyl-phosphate synthase large subunit [Candidatus Thermoplasmatota archaeon]MEE3081647.1 carbamoyl-phosphate synthase large subunit [Candidatus Thermoplasmatota archaeon]
MNKMKILVPGAGPIIIGQAAEFDYSGSQCCSSLREAGHEVVLVNSNPATIQTDPDTADIVYIEPLTVDSVEKIIEKERPDAIIPGMGGQTGLNLTVGLYEKGVLDKYSVKILGTSLKSIEMAEDRDLFRKRMEEIGEPVAKSGIAHTIEESLKLAEKLNYPVVIRPAFTLGGTGGGIAYTKDELEIISGRGLALSPVKQLLVEESILGWLEFEFEVLRDVDDNAIIVCSMENLDPMGVHTGESVVVAPSLTLPENAYQKLRTSALKVVKSLGIVGGCNVQFAYNSKTQDYILIEVNPRVSRSSALASKATGVPIARIAAMLCLGHRIHELPNRVTGNTSAAFEPSIDYVITKIPRWPFDKFKLADRELGTQMKSTGETMSIGRTFEESLMKAWRSIGQGEGFPECLDWSEERLKKNLKVPNDRRLHVIWTYLKNHNATQKSVDKVCNITDFHAFFIERIAKLVRLEIDAENSHKNLTDELLINLKKNGFGDKHISHLTGISQKKIRDKRKKLDIISSFLMVDTCAGEFEAKTPYFYSTYADNKEPIKTGKSIVILGSGPIRIGQGIEFDYSTVHGVQAARNAGYEAVVVNNNPETVSTDFDASDRLYFEPLDRESIFEILDLERPYGIVLQLGGQTAVNLATHIEEYIRQEKLPTKILGTSVTNMEMAEDREKCGQIMQENGIHMPEWAAAKNSNEVITHAERIGYPVLVRPSFVLGGRGMEIAHNKQQLEKYLELESHATPEKPVLVDKFLEGAVELDVDLISDGKNVVIGAIMEQIEMAGVHSGDSSCVMPPQSLDDKTEKEIIKISKKVAKSLGVVGAANLQLAIKDERIYLLEANPRASRTLPFVSKSTGYPLARMAVNLMLGDKITNLPAILPMEGASVKVPTFSWLKITGLDTVLGPEMKSTGEAMGHGPNFGTAYLKAMKGGNKKIPTKGTVFVSISNELKEEFTELAKRLKKLGFNLIATKGTAAHLRTSKINSKVIWRISDKKSPDILSIMREGNVNLIINLPTGKRAATDGAQMRRLAVELGIPFITTITGADAAIKSLEEGENNYLMPINKK